MATASLELGIDIGTVDLVVQISSPRAIAVALQRVGRSGHWRGAIPKGRFFAATRDDLMECAALVRAIRQGDLDRLIIPDAPLDILAQQIVATCAAEGSTARVARAPRPRTLEAASEVEDSKAELWTARSVGADMTELCLSTRGRGARATQTPPKMMADGTKTNSSPWSRAPIPIAIFRARLTTRSSKCFRKGIASRRGRYGAYIHHDRVNRKLRPRRGSRLAAITSGGAIPETALFTVVAEPEGIVVGTLDEDFAVESNAGDIMLLGNTSWRIRRVEGKSGRVLVEDAHGAPPSVPFWRGEAPARTQELSAHVAGLRKEISDRLRDISPVGISQSQPAVAETVAWLKAGVRTRRFRRRAGDRVHSCKAAPCWEMSPRRDTIIAERFFDEGGGMQLVIHAPFGGRINKAWGLALRKRFCRSFNFELQAAATDNGLNIALAEQHSFPLADVFHFLNAETVQPVLEQAALASPIFGTRWRWDANRALALLRFQGGKKVPPQIQRMRSDDLLASVFPDVAACQENIVGDIQIPDHPLVKEVMKDVLTEAMDIDGLQGLC